MRTGLPRLALRAIKSVPPPITRAVGRAQVRYPLLQRIVLKAAPAIWSQEGTIKHGPGAGLRFNPTGGQPGYLLGTSEPAEQRFLQERLTAGAVFYDIGANVGFFSTIAARLVGPNGSVWAFEPFAESAARARQNAHINGFNHVTVVEAAVSDFEGSGKLSRDDEPTQYRLATQSGGIEVPVVTIDGWRSRTGAPPPSVVMIDVEGEEINVLRGMAHTLIAFQPIVVCEVHRLGSDFLDFARDSLVAAGYTLEALEGRIPEVPCRWHAVFAPAEYDRP